MQNEEYEVILCFTLLKEIQCLKISRVNLFFDYNTSYFLCFLEVEMHRQKKHHDESPMISPNGMMPARHSNDRYSQSQAEDSVLHQQEGMEYCDSEDKQPKSLNFSIDSIESGRDPKSSIRSISVVKDEDPSSVTSSGCSPPLLSHIDSPMNVRQLRDEEKKDSLRNSENEVKPEPSSTKQSHSVESSHEDNKSITFRSMNNSPTKKESRESKF